MALFSGWQAAKDIELWQGRPKSTPEAADR
jgi:hypothetical protein